MPSTSIPPHQLLNLLPRRQRQQREMERLRGDHHPRPILQQRREIDALPPTVSVEPRLHLNRNNVEVNRPAQVKANRSRVVRKPYLRLDAHRRFLPDAGHLLHAFGSGREAGTVALTDAVSPQPRPLPRLAAECVTGYRATLRTTLASDRHTLDRVDRDDPLGARPWLRSCLRVGDRPLPSRVEDLLERRPLVALDVHSQHATLLVQRLPRRRSTCPPRPNTSTAISTARPMPALGAPRATRTPTSRPTRQGWPHDRITT
jgi:hypothetical protein